MALNKQHPDCMEYTRRWNELWAQMDKELCKVSKSSRTMRDGNESHIYKKYAAQMKALQMEYAHLFSDDVE